MATDAILERFMNYKMNNIQLFNLTKKEVPYSLINDSLQDLNN